jgi:hypothetical protein
MTRIIKIKIHIFKQQIYIIRFYSRAHKRGIRRIQFCLNNLYKRGNSVRRRGGGGIDGQRKLNILKI